MRGAEEVKFPRCSARGEAIGGDAGGETAECALFNQVFNLGCFVRSAEEVKFQQSGGAAKRQEAMQRVREREREERTRAREVARQKELAERWVITFVTLAENCSFQKVCHLQQKEWHARAALQKELSERCTFQPFVQMSSLLGSITVSLGRGRALTSGGGARRS